MFRSSSQDLVAASGQRRPAKPSGALCIMQSSTTCCTDCVMCPQAHVADSWSPQSFNVSPTPAVPQRRRFSFTHCLRWRSAPGGSTGLGWRQAVRMGDGPLSTRSLHALAGSQLSLQSRAAWDESLRAGRIDGRYLVVEEMIRVVLGGRSYSRHTCLTP